MGGCATKQRYRSRKFASARASAERRRSGEPIEAYHCHVHHCWHVGHPPGWRARQEARRWYDLGPGPTAVLLALVVLADEQVTVTIRDVAARAGRGVGNTYDDLLELYRAGLVSWESGAAGTLRPRVERVA